MTKRKKLWIAAAAVAVLILLGLAVLAGFRNGKSPGPEQPADIAIETPVCTLYYPADWQDRVSWEIREKDGVTVSFFGRVTGDTPLALFDVSFLPEPENSLGMVEAGEKTWYVRIETFPADGTLVDTAEEKYLFNAMQEALNHLLEKLPMTGSEPAESLLLVPAETAPAADILVETPYGLLACPGIPGYTVTARATQEELYRVTYVWERSAEMEVALFEIAFGGEEALASGFLAESGTPVRLTLFPLEQTLSGGELDTALRLQELVNSVLEGLPLMQRTELPEAPADQTGEGETTAPETEASEPEDARTEPSAAPEEETSIQQPWDAAAETPYGFLCFPQEHQENLSTEVTQTQAGCTVRFLYIRDNGQSCPLFDVVLGGSGDFRVGTLSLPDGTELAVELISHSPETDASWSRDDETKFYAMAEGANYLFDRLAQLYAFTFVK